MVQVTCPSCGALTMAASVCFSCGQPLPANVASQGAAAPYPLTGQLGAMPLTPPPNPYASGGFKLVGASVSHTIRPGGEVRVGRDPARCAITLNEPRVSGLHATLKLDGGQLWVRDETSNNGTFVAGARIAPGAWVVVPPGSQLRFGPISFDVQTDG